MTTRLNFTNGRDEQCIACLKDKQTRKSFGSNNTRKASKPLEIVHSDLCGPCQNIHGVAKDIYSLLLMIFPEKSMYSFLSQKVKYFQLFQFLSRTISAW